MTWKTLLVVLFTSSTTSTSPPCIDVTHSECGDDDGHLFLETTVPNKVACHLVCMALAEKCHFLLFDNLPFARGNCRLYDESFSKYILHCNELAGPKTSADGCDFLNPPDNSCQIYRSGHCDFGRADETEYFSSWENCQAACKSTSLCNFWQFEIEEGQCRILYSAEKICTWEFSPREPNLEDCHNCDIPEAQKYGDWFCPPSPSTNTATCHLECYPGYVSTNRTIVTCTEGIWSSAPTCVPAIGLITGSYFSNTVEIYGDGIHQMLPNLPEGREGHSLQTTDSFVILCGGHKTTTSCLVLTESQHWTPHSTTTSPREYHSSVSILGQLHLLGGRSSSRSTEHLAPATSTTWFPGPDLNEHGGIGIFCAAKINAEVYIITGWSVFSYNVTSGAVTRLQDLTIPRTSHGCTYVRDSQTGFKGVLVAGGEANNPHGKLSQSEMYDLSTGQWTTTSRGLHVTRVMLKLMVLSDKILAFGGHDGITGELSSVERFNLTSGKWSYAEEMLEARRSHAVTGIQPCLVGIGPNYN